VTARKFLSVRNPSRPQYFRDVNIDHADMESTVDKFHLRPHIVSNATCEGARWNQAETKWEVRFIDEKTKRRYVKKATIFISAIGSIAEPRKATFPGQNEFKGTIFHTARWNTKYDYRGKRMALIGNGCSAAQVVPSVVRDVKHITQYVLSALSSSGTSI
jgi:cation diffusion facilitator CzcD-associated flavoprotein CzcO